MRYVLVKASPCTLLECHQVKVNIGEIMKHYAPSKNLNEIYLHRARINNETPGYIYTCKCKWEVKEIEY